MYKNEKDRRLTESFVKYGTVILKHCCDYLKDKHEAEDVLQETFYKFGENYEKVPEEKTRTWLLVTASHQCLDLMKKSGRKRTVVGLPVPDVEDLIDPIDLVGSVCIKRKHDGTPSGAGTASGGESHMVSGYCVQYGI